MPKKTPGAPPKGPRARKPDAAVAQPAEPRASTPKTTGSSPAGRSKPDWDAIEAAHRTGRYSDGQLAEIHKVSREAIVRKRKKDQAEDPKRWQKDLREQVRQATAALLMRDEVLKQQANVTATITEGHTASQVVIAAECAKQVIQAHQQRAASLIADSDQARSKLMGLLDTVADIREAGVAAAALESLVRTSKTLIDIQRKAHNLDDPGEKPPADTPDPTTVTRETAVDAYRGMVNG